MNKGEKDELIVQLKLIQLRDDNICINDIGLLTSIKFKNEYKSLPQGLDINTVVNYTETQLNILTHQCGISKAGTRFKADTIINGEPISIKSKKYAPPALANHTARPGFEFAGKQAGGDIDKLDTIIEKYWEKRVEKLIREDVPNSHIHSPFKDEKEIIRPFLNYFLFDGTGGSLSLMPAKRILGFTDPLNIDTWHFYDRVNAINMYWDKLVFSLRANKGMPKYYPNLTKKMIATKPSIAKWTKYIDGHYRGALHIRSK